MKDTAFANPVRVAVLDQNGAVLTSATGAIALALGANPGSATLSGTTSANAVSGVATFSSLNLNALGTGYTFVASTAGLPNATSATFNVTLSLADADGDTYSPNAGDCNDGAPSIHPGAVDVPEPAYIDTNCDGIDGDASKAIFASPAGADGASCGTRVSPCATIATSLTRASTQTKRDVYLAQGTYAGAVTLANGVSIYGGFDAAWARSAANVTTITGSDAVDAGGTDPQALTIYGADLTQPATIADVTIAGPNASGVVSNNGRSSYGVVLRNVAAGILTLTRISIVAGNGASGVAGTNGANAPTLAATAEMRGGDGGDGDQPGGLACDDFTWGAGGTKGKNSADVGMDGGGGGIGGMRDKHCGSPVDFNARSGNSGSDAAALFASPMRGYGGAGGDPCGDPDAPAAGFPGHQAFGAAGGGAASGRLIGDFWYGGRGGNGGISADGGGGGGGGGEGGCDIGADSYGAGGGGGGAGGLAARGAGGGGGGGGGSFGVYLIDASPALTQLAITLGVGGDGGDGGIGGQGQSGARGGAGGIGVYNNGGRGGDGAHGSHGGGGGGGAGGYAVGIQLTSGTSVPTTDAVTVTGGTPGPGGSGGLSAPNAPVAERDGHPGTTGTNGLLISFAVCLSPTKC